MDNKWHAKRINVGESTNPNYYAKVMNFDGASILIHTIFEELNLKAPDYWVSARDINNIFEIDWLSYCEHLDDIDDNVIELNEMYGEQFILCSELYKISKRLEDEKPYTAETMIDLLDKINKNIKRIMYNDKCSLDENTTDCTDCDSCKYKQFYNDCKCLINKSK